MDSKFRAFGLCVELNRLRFLDWKVLFSNDNGVGSFIGFFFAAKCLLD